MPNQLNRLGTSVRFPLDDLEDYRLIGERLYGLPASKVIQAITVELVTSVARESGEEIELMPSGLIKTLFQSDELRAICTRIFDRRDRELPNSDTQSIWIGFSSEQMEGLSQVARVLQWPLSKLVQQALKDALTIVADKSEGNGEDKSQDKNAAADIPIIATFYLGITYAKRSIKPGLKKKLDETVKKWEESKPRPNGSLPDHVGQPIQDDIGITREEK